MMSMPNCIFWFRMVIGISAPLGLASKILTGTSTLAITSTIYSIECHFPYDFLNPKHMLMDPPTLSDDALVVELARPPPPPLLAFLKLHFALS